jgi:Cu/Ag efflux protein CusF
MTRSILPVALGCIVVAASSVLGGAPGGESPVAPVTMPVPPAPVTAPAWLATGEVRSVDRIAGTVTIRHARLTKLDVPAATTVFRVREPAFLDQTRVGRKIRFSAARIDGALTMTHLELSRRQAGRP